MDIKDEAARRYNELRQVKHAYGLPAGSIRALLALIVFGAIGHLMATQPTVAVPAYLSNLMFIIMGHYFASRNAKDRDPAEPNPLYLPKGTVRILLISGFVATAVWLTHTSQWVVGGALSQSGIALILVLGFLLGVLRGKIFKTQRRWLEDLRATVSLAAGVALLLMVFGYLKVPDIAEVNEFQSLAVQFRYEEVLAGVVGFYFGSKS